MSFPVLLRTPMPRRNRRPSWSELADPHPASGDESPSKTALKKQAHALQDLGLALTRLPSDQRQAVEMPQDLREAVENYLKTRSHEARRRQLQFIGKLLRRVDPTPLLAAVERFQSGRSADAEKLHAIEGWRDALIADDEAMTRWITAHPETDVQQLRSLIRAARSEGASQDVEQRQPKSYRQLFRYIRRVMDASSSP